MVRKPCASRLPTSPVCSQPPRSVFAVASGLLPVAGHHAVGARDDLAGLARRAARGPRRRRSSPRTPVRAKPQVSRCSLLRDGIPAASPVIVIGALALAEELVQARAEQVDRAQAVGDVHRRAAVADGLQVRAARARRGWRAGAPPWSARRRTRRSASGRAARRSPPGRSWPLSGMTLTAPAAKCGRPYRPEPCDSGAGVQDRVAGRRACRCRRSRPASGTACCGG